MSSNKVHLSPSQKPSLLISASPLSTPILYSSSNASPSSLPASLQVKCPTHNFFFLTNICMSEGCIEPLCPECFSYHLQVHNEMGTVCKVETLMGIREVCLEHILKIQAVLQEERESISKFIQKKQNPNDETFKKISKARKNLLDIVNGFFDRLENEVHQNFEKFTVEHMQECIAANKKLESMLEELENIEKELNGAEYIRVMLKIFMDGLDPKFTANSKNIEELLTKAKVNATNMKIDDSKLYNINVELNKYVCFAKNDPLNQRLAENFNFQNKNNFVPLKSLSGEQKLVRNTEIIENSVKEFESKNKDSIGYKYDRFSSLKGAPMSRGGLEFTSEMKANNEIIIDERILKESINFETSDYFKPDCNNKLLCFFQDNSKKFHFINLETLNHSSPSFIEKELSINFKIPIYHRSIITREGSVYLIGGLDSENKNLSINKTYILNMEENDFELLPRNYMLSARSSHSICYFKNYIVVVGGMNDIHQDYLDSCEKFNEDANEWYKMSSCKVATIGATICGYNDRFIFKFGGKDNKGSLSNVIEKYYFDSDMWETIIVKDYESRPFKMPNFSASYQVNKNEVILFGGNLYEHNLNSCYSFEFNEHKNNYRFNESKNKLPSAGTYWNNPILFENVLFSIQNIRSDANKDICLFGKKKLLIFNSKLWKEF